MRPIFQHKSLSQSEINHVEFVGFLAPTHNKVIRLYIPMNIVLAMNELNPLDHLIAEDECGFETELSSIGDEQVFKGLTKQIHHHHVVFALIPTIIYPWHSIINGGIIGCQTINNFSLIEELGTLAPYGLQFNSHFEMTFVVEGHKYLSKCP